MADITACMSSKTDNWSTPQDFFNKLDDEFHFTLDPCADNENHKCNFYYTKEQDGLKQDWGGGDCILQSSVWSRNCILKLHIGLNMHINKCQNQILWL